MIALWFVRRFLGALASYDEFTLTPVQTDIVMFGISASGMPSGWFGQQIAPLGLQTRGMGNDHRRLTTCRGVGHRGIARAIKVFGCLWSKTSPLGLSLAGGPRGQKIALAG